MNLIYNNPIDEYKRIYKKVEEKEKNNYFREEVRVHNGLLSKISLAKGMVHLEINKEFLICEDNLKKMKIPLSKINLFKEEIKYIYIFVRDILIIVPKELGKENEIRELKSILKENIKFRNDFMYKQNKDVIRAYMNDITRHTKNNFIRRMIIGFIEILICTLFLISFNVSIYSYIIIMAIIILIQYFTIFNSNKKLKRKVKSNLRDEVVNIRLEEKALVLIINEYEMTYDSNIPISIGERKNYIVLELGNKKKVLFIPKAVFSNEEELQSFIYSVQYINIF